jgi:predicted nucleotidyltransferase
VIALIEQRKASIAEVCCQFGVGRLEVFGSASGGDLQPERSGLDFITQFSGAGYAGSSGV